MSQRIQTEKFVSSKSYSDGCLEFMSFLMDIIDDSFVT